MRRAVSAPLVAAIGVVAVLGATACGARGRLVLPAGAGEPDAGAHAAFAAATEACRQVRTLTAEAALSGRANGRRVRARLLVGVERPDRLRLEALAPFGAPVFVLVARDGRGRLWIPREQSAVTDAAVPELVGAVAGLEPSGEELVALLTGCVVVADASPEGGGRYANGWRRLQFGGGADVWLRDDTKGPRVIAGRLGTPDRTSAASASALTVEYSDHQNGLPRTVRLLADTRGSAGTDLTLRLSGVEINTDLDAKAFELAIPDGTRATSLENLRRSGVFGSGS